jgi:hypothetical protein
MKAIGLSLLAGMGILALLSQTPAPPPTASVQLINASSVPWISLRLNQNEAYPVFRQGQRTSPGHIEKLRMQYLARDPATGRTGQTNFVFSPAQFYSVVMIGNFSTNAPPSLRPAPARIPPDFTYLLLDHERTPGQSPCRVTLVNGLPKTDIAVLGEPQIPEPLAPRQIAHLHGKPPECKIRFRIDGKTGELWIGQSPPHRNSIIAFYLQNGRPKYKIVFETTADYLRKVD